MTYQINKYDIYGTRLLIFLETEPQSNDYHQVKLTPEEFKRASLAIGTVVSRKGSEETVEMQLSEEVYKLPDLPEHYATPTT
jgi:hypothetical protein